MRLLPADSQVLPRLPAAAPPANTSIRKPPRWAATEPPTGRATLYRPCPDTLRNAPPAWTAAMFEALERRRTTGHLEASGERTMMDALRQDIRFGLRSWRRRPGLAAVALVTLALGIGVNTAMFSIVNAVLLRALPFRNAERLVLIWARTPTNPQTIVSYPEFQELRRENRTFDDVALWLTQSVNLTGS